mmetsp:Transcript_23867/g.50768  ORF Transcript_23867/g.50768 Transcript_23867/m.50768 type:complete len:273 (-) Transcript_23867:223-1041(-)
MGDLGSSFLEGCVDKTSVGVLLRVGIESTGDQVLDGNLDGTHVALSGEVEVFVEKITVSVLLGRPSTAPFGPWRVRVSGWIVATLEGVQQGLVSGKSLFRDHVTDQNHHDLIGEFFRHVAEVLHILFPAVLGKVGEEVLGLPRCLASLQKDLVDHGSGNRGNVVDNLHVLGVQELVRLESLQHGVLLEIGSGDVLELLLGYRRGIDGHLQLRGGTRRTKGGLLSLEGNDVSQRAESHQYPHEKAVVVMIRHFVVFFVSGFDQAVTNLVAIKR